MQQKIRDKQRCFRELLNCTDGEEKVRVRENYKIARKEAKKAVAEANRAYKRMYERLETKDGERDIFKITKTRDRKSQVLRVVKFIKGEDEHGK